MTVTSATLAVIGIPCPGCAMVFHSGHEVHTHVFSIHPEDPSVLPEANGIKFDTVPCPCLRPACPSRARWLAYHRHDVVDSHDVLSNTGHYKIVHEDPRMGTLAEIYGLLVTITLQDGYVCPCQARAVTLAALDEHVMALHFDAQAFTTSTPDPDATAVVELLPPAMSPPVALRPPTLEEWSNDNDTHDVTLPPFYSSTLQRANLKLTDLQALVCLTCKVGVYSKQTVKHVLGHQPSMTKDQAMLAKTLDDLVRYQFVATDHNKSAIRPMVESNGVCRYREELQDPIAGFRCLAPGCRHAFIGANNHYHHDHFKSHPQLAPCKMQTLYSSSYFPVGDPPDKSGSEGRDSALDIADQLAALSAAPVHSSSTWREINQLVAVAGWTSTLGKITSDANLLANALTVSAIPHAAKGHVVWDMLSSLSTHFVKSARLAAHSTKDTSFPFRIMQTVMVDEEKTFMEFLREESSEERYATELARFCLVSLRLTYSMDQADGAALSNAGMRLNFTQDCLARLGELAQWIRSQSQLWALGPTNAQREHGCRVIQALFFEVFTGGLSESQWHDGIVLYTGIQALRASGWQDAKDMTGLFAKFKYLIRISIIHKVMDDSNDPSERCQMAEELSERWLRPRPSTTWESLSRLQSLASAMAYTHVHAPNVVWDATHNIVSVDGRRVSVMAVRHGNHLMAEHCKQAAARIACNRHAVPSTMSPSSIYVAHGSARSVLDHESLVMSAGSRNPIIKAWATELGQGMAGRAWNPTTMRGFLARSGQWWIEMAVLLLVVMAPPSRGTDFTSITHRDGLIPASLRRDHDMWHIQFSHSKITSTSFSSTAFVPAELDALFTWGLQLRQAEILVARALLGNAAADVYDKYLFVVFGVEVNSGDLSEHLSRLTEKYWNAAFTLRRHRQLAQAFCNAYVPKEDSRLDRSLINSAPANRAMGHNERTAGQHYARDHVDGGMMTEMFKEYLHLGLFYQNLVFTPSGRLPPRPLLSFPADAHTGLCVAAGTSAHPDRGDRLSRAEVIELIEASVAKSHGPLQVALESQSRKYIQALEDAMDRRLRSGIHTPAIVSATDHDRDRQSLTRMQLALGLPNATFKPGQAELLRVLYSLIPVSVLAVLPCNSGKTLAFMLPSRDLLSKLLHLVIVPYVSIIKQHAEQARALGIPVVDLARDGSPSGHLPQTGIILVTPEQFESTGFSTKIREVVSQQRLGRITIDEVHDIGTTSKGPDAFRPAFQTLMTYLQEMRVPLTLLSGTMPRQLWPAFARHIGLNAALIEEVRTPCVRPDLSYIILPRPDDKSRIDILSRLGEHLLTLCRVEYGANSLGIVYCTSIDHVEQLCDSTPGALPYHSRLSDEQRQSHLLSWTSGAHPLMVATTSFIMGIHNPNVRFVVHASHSYGLLNIYQGWCRAGRDGCGGLAIMLADSCPAPRDSQSAPDLTGWSMVQPLYVEALCRRKSLGVNLDGLVRDAIKTCVDDSGLLPCDLCSKDEFREQIIVMRSMVLDPPQATPSAAISPSALFRSPPIVHAPMLLPEHQPELKLRQAVSGRSKEIMGVRNLSTGGDKKTRNIVPTHRRQFQLPIAQTKATTAVRTEQTWTVKMPAGQHPTLGKRPASQEGVSEDPPSAKRPRASEKSPRKLVHPPSPLPASPFFSSWGDGLDDTELARLEEVDQMAPQPRDLTVPSPSPRIPSPSPVVSHTITDRDLSPDVLEEVYSDEMEQQEEVDDLGDMDADIPHASEEEAEEHDVEEEDMYMDDPMLAPGRFHRDDDEEDEQDGMSRTDRVTRRNSHSQAHRSAVHRSQPRTPANPQNERRPHGQNHSLSIRSTSSRRSAIEQGSPTYSRHASMAHASAPQPSQRKHLHARSTRGSPTSLPGSSLSSDSKGSAVLAWPSTSSPAYQPRGGSARYTISASSRASEVEPVQAPVPRLPPPVKPSKILPAPLSKDYLARDDHMIRTIHEKMSHWPAGYCFLCFLQIGQMVSMKAHNALMATPEALGTLIGHDDLSFCVHAQVAQFSLTYHRTPSNFFNWRKTHFDAKTADVKLCYKCHIPLSTSFYPPFHVMRTMDVMGCPNVHLVSLVSWFVYHNIHRTPNHPTPEPHARLPRPVGVQDMSEETYGVWCLTVKPNSAHTNSLWLLYEVLRHLTIPDPVVEQ